MKLSVCMIVKNEEKILEQCLNCVKEFADEIIIVDTGSSDKTVELAKKFTDKVYNFKWCNDFSKARNFSFEKASLDYVCWLDADDYINKENLEKIKKLKNSNNNNADVYMCKYGMCFDEQNNPQFIYYRERILRRNLNFKWQGFIHEAICPVGEIEYTDILIEHHSREKSNPKRNLQIYQYHIKKGEILDARAQYYFAKEYFYNKMYSQCEKNLKKYLKMPNKFMPNVIDAYITLASCLIQKNKTEKALDLLLKSLKEIEPNAQLCCKIAQVFILLNKKQNAIIFYKLALNCDRDEKSGDFICKQYTKLIPLLQLTYLYFKQGDLKNSYKYHLLCLQEFPNDKAVVFNDKYFKDNGFKQ